MQKIMFDDRFGLTEAVLNGRKTMTRRVIPAKAIEYILGEFKQEYFEGTLDFFDSDKRYIEQYYLVEKCGKCFRPGDIVAVAQRYSECVNDILISWGHKKDIATMAFKKLPGWNNKMFVKAEWMPHQIRITNVSVECLQDISDEDCLREGVMAESIFDDNDYCTVPGIQRSFKSPREAFAALIDKMSGKRVWDDNPYVFVYEFELVK